MATDLFTLGIPFFFMLAVVFGALEVSGVFKNRGVKAIIALVIAFFAATYEPATTLIFSVLPLATIFFIAVFFLGFLASFFKREGGAKDWALIAVIIILFALLLLNIEALTGTPLGDQAMTFVTIIGIILIAMIFYAAYRYAMGGEGRQRQ